MPGLGDSFPGNMAMSLLVSLALKTAQVFLFVHLVRGFGDHALGMFSKTHSSTSIMRKTRMRTRLAVVIAMAMSPLLGGFEAEFIKTNVTDPQSGSQDNHLEIRVRTKASSVQQLIKELLNMQ